MPFWNIASSKPSPSSPSFLGLPWVFGPSQRAPLPLATLLLWNMISYSYWCPKRVYFILLFASLILMSLAFFTTTANDTTSRKGWRSVDLSGPFSLLYLPTLPAVSQFFTVFLSKPCLALDILWHSNFIVVCSTLIIFHWKFRIFPVTVVAEHHLKTMGEFQCS